MLIVCPSCATSYMIDQASLGPAGRMVRCARCKTTWLAGHPESAPVPAPKGVLKPDKGVSAFVDGVIAEADMEAAQSASTTETPPAPPALPPMPSLASPPDDFGVEAAEVAPHLPKVGDFELGHLAHAEPAAPIHDAPPLVPPIEQAPSAADNADIESFVARRQRLQKRRKTARRSSRWTAVVLVLVAFNVAVVGARNEVVRYLPQTAGLFAAIGLPVNLRQLKFDNVRISKEIEDGIAILVVEGTIVSESNKTVEVPRLRFAARNAAGQEIYNWTMQPDRKSLGPGEHLDFRSRLASPPKDAKDVMVRFFTANDAMAGGK